MNALIYKPQVKICGVTNLEDALLCLNAGVDAIGFIFTASPRRITAMMADQITAQLPHNSLRKVGIFVDTDFNNIMQHVRMANLDTVQLHGNESGDLIKQLQAEGLRVIKVLFQKYAPHIHTSVNYAPDAFLLESDNQPETLAAIRDCLTDKPFILAGGLNAANLEGTIEALSPDAIDLNSGSEYTFGIKSAAKITAIMDIINNIKYNKPVRRVF